MSDEEKKERKRVYGYPYQGTFVVLPSDFEWYEDDSTFQMLIEADKKWKETHPISQ